MEKLPVDGNLAMIAVLDNNKERFCVARGTKSGKLYPFQRVSLLSVLMFWQVRLLFANENRKLTCCLGTFVQIRATRFQLSLT